MYSIQEAHGIEVWQRPFTQLRLPYIFNLRQDPLEKAFEESGSYEKWWFENLFILYGCLAESQKFLMSFKDFPPRQRPDSFSIDKIAEKLMNYESVQYR
jgi:arylsulfatase